MADMKLWTVEFNTENPQTKQVYLVGAPDIYEAITEAQALYQGDGPGDLYVHPGPELNNWPSVESTIEIEAAASQASR